MPEYNKSEFEIVDEKSQHSAESVSLDAEECASAVCSPKQIEDERGREQCNEDLRERLEDYVHEELRTSSACGHRQLGDDDVADEKDDECNDGSNTHDFEKDSDEVDDKGVPVDKGWAWMVSLGCYMLFFVYTAYDQFISVLLLELISKFDTSVSVITAMLSVSSICYCLATQIAVNILVKKYSIRYVEFGIATTNVAATLLFTAVPSMPMFFICNMVKCYCKGSTLVATLTLVGTYFRRRRAVATSLGLLGASSSIVVSPPLIRYLRDTYGLRGCLLLLAGLELHAIVAALLLRPTSFYTKRRNVPQDNTNSSKLEQLQQPLIQPSLKENSHFPSKDLGPAALEANISKPTDENCCLKLQREPEDGAYPRVEKKSEGHVPKSHPHHECQTLHGDRSKNVTSDAFMALLAADGTNKEIHSENYVHSEATSTNSSEDVCKSKEHSYADKKCSHESIICAKHNDREHSETTVPEIQEDSANHTICKCGSPKCQFSFTDRLVMDNFDKYGKTRSDSDGDVRQNSGKESNKLHLSNRGLGTELKYRGSKLSLMSTSVLGSSVNIAEPPEDDIESQQDKTRTNRCPFLCITNIIDFSMLKNFLCLAVIFVYVFSNTAFFNVIYLPSYATKVNVVPQKAAILLTIIGALDMVGRISFAFVADLRKFPPSYLMAAGCITLGVVCQFVRTFHGFEELAFFAVVQGLLGSSCSNLATILIVDILGLEYLGKLLAMSSMFLAAGVAVQHPIQGALIDATGNFLATFHYVGTCQLATGTVLLLVPRLKKIQAARDQKKLRPPDITNE